MEVALNKEAIYEQKVAAWIEHFRTKADGKKVKKKAAKKEAGARAGTTWEFVPAGCQLRNGLAKAGVPATKWTVAHMLATTVNGEKPIDVKAMEKKKAALRDETMEESPLKKEAGARAGSTWKFIPAGCQL